MSCCGRCRSIQRIQGITALGLGEQILSAMVGYVECQFQPTPNPQLVKCTAQMVLDHLFAGADDLADFAIGRAFPGYKRNPTLGWLQTVAWRHDCAFSCVQITN